MKRASETNSKEVSSETLPWLSLDSGEVGKFRTACVAVVGDVILDEYLDGSVTRISPEAPVPVHQVVRTTQTAGGAANVARNIKLSGGEVLLFSSIGADSAGEQLRDILTKDHIATDNLVSFPERVTIKKTRVTANNHQLLRVDWERIAPIKEEIQVALLKRLQGCAFDALLISDYGKGGVPSEFTQKLISEARRRGVPAIVDPKGSDYSRYRDAFLVTPNRNEAWEALGLSPTDAADPEDVGRRIRQKFGIENVLVTLGANGMLLVTETTSHHLPAVAREVFDVSGAGDTVVAIMSLSIAAGSSLEVAMKFANLAAGRVVEKWGTQPITREEIEQELSAERKGSHDFSYEMTEHKVLSREQVTQLVGLPSHRRKRVVFTNGCFDILHAGHVSYLDQARALGDILVIGVNSDQSVKRLKGASRPINPLADRLKMLAGLQCATYVVSFEEDTPAGLIEAVMPDVLIKGADWADKGIVGSDFVKSYGGRVATVPLVPGRSTTDIINRIKTSDPV